MARPRRGTTSPRPAYVARRIAGWRGRGQLRVVLHPLPADKSLLRLTRGGWDPNAFVDLAEQVYNRPEDSRQNAAIVLQKLEWRLLFDHCMRAASGQ